MKKTIFSLVFILAVGVAVYFGFFNNKQEFIYYKEPVYSAEAKADAEEKLVLLQERVSSLNEESPEEEQYNAITALGNQYYLLGMFREARDVYLRAAEMNPDNYTSWVNLFLVENDMGDYDSAYKHIKKATEKVTFRSDPWLWRIDFEIGVLQRSNQEIENLFAEALEQTKDTDGNLDIAKRYARFLEESGQIEKAYNMWRNIADSFPEDEIYRQEAERLEKLVNQ